MLGILSTETINKLIEVQWVFALAFLVLVILIMFLYLAKD